MIHKFTMKGINIVLDVNSGIIHVVDSLIMDMLDLIDSDVAENCPSSIIDALDLKYPKSDINEAYEEIYRLYKSNQLFSKDNYEDAGINMKKNTPVKALCLHICHDCNLKCKYCFAEEGTYNSSRSMMSEKIGKSSIDFVIKRSGKRRNIEIDFFGGEPLMNFDVVKNIVAYANEQGEIHGKKFRFTITTNGLMLNDSIIEYINEHMSNVVLSLDGRREVNDKMRIRLDNSGTYDRIVPKLLQVAKSRNNDNYYVRGTFTRHNLDFSKDVLHLADLGFEQTSVEPVVAADSADYAIRESDLPVVFKEYEELAVEYLKRKKDGRGFNFFHFMIDLEGGPCVIKRLSGCGAGCEYLAVTPNGDIYPCHQFAGNHEYCMGNVLQDNLNQSIKENFESVNVYTKPDCIECFAKFYCSGGCLANACNLNGDIKKPHKISCEMQRKRVECALYIKAAEAANN